MEHNFSNQNRVEMSDYRYTGVDIYAVCIRLHDSFPPHWHDHYEIEYFTDGKGYQIINGVKSPIVPGTLCVLSPTDFHEVVVEEPLEVLKIAYQESDIDSFVSSLFIGYPINSSIYLNAEVRQFFAEQFNSVIQTIEKYGKSPHGKASSQKLVEALILNIINWYSMHNSDSQNSDSAPSNDIHKILAYIHKNFNKQINLKKVAESSHFSPHYLSKLFHQIMGITFKGYVTNLQMNYASKLILNTNKSITDICYEAGFGSLSNFTREFKKFYTISPSEYRKINKSAIRETENSPLNLHVDFMGKHGIETLKNKYK